MVVLNETLQTRWKRTRQHKIFRVQYFVQHILFSSSSTYIMNIVFWSVLKNIETSDSIVLAFWLLYETTLLPYFMHKFLLQTFIAPPLLPLFASPHQTKRLSIISIVDVKGHGRLQYRYSQRVTNQRNVGTWCACVVVSTKPGNSTYVWMEIIGVWYIGLG